MSQDRLGRRCFLCAFGRGRCDKYACGGGLAPSPNGGRVFVVSLCSDNELQHIGHDPPSLLLEQRAHGLPPCGPHPPLKRADWTGFKPQVLEVTVGDWFHLLIRLYSHDCKPQSGGKTAPKALYPRFQKAAG